MEAGICHALKIPVFYPPEITYFAVMPMEELVKSLVRDVKDFPKPGIIFKDITPLLAAPRVRQQVVEDIANHFRPLSFDAVAAVEARGFIFGTLIAQELGLPFIPIRKSGKLPFQKIQETYSLEYGSASIEMHTDAVDKGWKILLHDDLLATGGTTVAATQLIQRLGAMVTGFSFIINLAFLPGEKALTERFNIKPHYVVKYS